MATAYHVTLAENVQAIVLNGLRPMIGERSAELGEKEERIYLFPTKPDCETALSNWLGEQFDEDQKLVILEIDISGIALTSDAGFEISCNSTIMPDRINNIFDEAWQAIQTAKKPEKTMRKAEKIPTALAVSPCIQDNAIEVFIDNARPGEVREMLEALWAACGPKERFSLIQSEAARGALDTPDVYRISRLSESSWGFTGCESDSYQSESEATIAATEHALEKLGLKPQETELTLAKARFLELMSTLSAQGKLFHLDDSPENIVNNETGERIFTDAEADKIGEQIDEAREILGQDLMWDLAWPILNPPDQQLENGQSLQ
jgi:hypothetical protein